MLVPKPPTARILRVVANSMAFKTHVFVTHLIFKSYDIESAILSIDASLASFLLNFKHG